MLQALPRGDAWSNDIWCSAITGVCSYLLASKLRRSNQKKASFEKSHAFYFSCHEFFAILKVLHLSVGPSFQKLLRFILRHHLESEDFSVWCIFRVIQSVCEAVSASASMQQLAQQREGTQYCRGLNSCRHYGPLLPICSNYSVVYLKHISTIDLKLPSGNLSTYLCQHKSLPSTNTNPCLLPTVSEY